MASLRDLIPLACLPLLTICACGKVTVTKVINLETDTYISSRDLTNHSELPYSKIAKDGGGEERIILKLPTGKQDTSANLDSVLANPVAVITAPYLILVEVLASILDCQTNVLQPQNLTSAKLMLDILQNDEGGDLSGKIGLSLLAKPWWQNTDWNQAHYFSARGRWTSGGGDIDPGFTTINSSASGNSVVFDITSYFQSLIQQQGQAVHYGMLLKATGPSLGTVLLTSTQTEAALTRPRIVATYTGSCLGTQASGATRTFILGTPR